MMDSDDDYPMGNISKDYILDLPISNLETTTEIFIPDPILAAPSWQDNQTMPSSASESTYSRPSDNSRHHRFPIRTSSGNWSTHVPYLAAANETRSTGLGAGGYHIPFTYSACPPMYQQLYGDSMGLPPPGYEDSTLIFDPDQIKAITSRIVAASSTNETVERGAQAPHKGSSPIAPRAQGQHVQQPYVRHGRPRVFCNMCNDHPDGFEGDGKLQQHKIKMHGRTAKKFLCRDPATVGLVSKIQAIKPLSNCKACSNGKQYSADYIAVAHLLRAHFDPEASRRKNKNNANVSSGKGGGTRPPLEDLKSWYTEIPAVVLPEAPQVTEYLDSEKHDELDSEISAEELEQAQFSPINAVGSLKLQMQPLFYIFYISNLLIAFLG